MESLTHKVKVKANPAISQHHLDMPQASYLYNELYRFHAMIPTIKLMTILQSRWMTLALEQLRNKCWNMNFFYFNLEKVAGFIVAKTAKVCLTFIINRQRWRQHTVQSPGSRFNIKVAFVFKVIGTQANTSLQGFRQNCKKYEKKTLIVFGLFAFSNVKRIVFHQKELKK